MAQHKVVLSNSVTDQWSVWAWATTIGTYAIPAGLLVNTGDFFSAFVAGTFAANINAKRIQINLWATQIFDTGSQIQNGWSWAFDIRIVRLLAGTQKVVVSSKYSNAVTLFDDITEYLTTAVNLAVAQNLTVVATGVSNNDIVKTIMTAET